MKNIIVITKTRKEALSRASWLYEILRDTKDLEFDYYVLKAQIHTRHVIVSYIPEEDYTEEMERDVLIKDKMSESQIADYILGEEKAAGEQEEEEN